MIVHYKRGPYSKSNLKNMTKSVLADNDSASTSGNTSGYSLEKTIPDPNDFYTQSYPESSLFPADVKMGKIGKRGSLTDEACESVYRAWTEGKGVRELSDEFGCSERLIRQAIAKVQFSEIQNLPLDFIPNSEFTNKISRKKEQAILGYCPAEKSAKSETGGFDPLLGPLSDIPLYLSRIGKLPLLTACQESHLFRKMNYLKFKAATLREGLDSRSPKVAVMNRIKRLYEEMIEVKNFLIASNLRLVVSIAKSHETNVCTLYELISDGNISLMRAVEKFDYSRGNKFSTYASWAISRNFSRTIPNEKKYHSRYYSGDAEVFETRVDDRSSYRQDERIYDERVAQINRFMDCLDERERDIIARRYGLGDLDSPQTLRQVGRELGVTKERVRQIETRALAKLRKTAKDEKLEMPEPY